MEYLDIVDELDNPTGQREPVADFFRLDYYCGELNGGGHDTGHIST